MGDVEGINEYKIMRPQDLCLIKFKNVFTCRIEQMQDKQWLVLYILTGYNKKLSAT
jgi:hypothetical protein